RPRGRRAGARRVQPCAVCGGVVPSRHDGSSRGSDCRGVFGFVPWRPGHRPLRSSLAAAGGFCAPCRRPPCVRRGGQHALRVWVALAFGWVHGFAFANALNAMDRPLRGFALGALSFGGAAEASLLFVALAVLSLTALIAPQGRGASRALAIASVAVAAAGA